MDSIHVQQWDEDKFFRSRKEWNKLLKSSNSDKLFLSWEWQSTWWKVFSEPENTDSEKMELQLYVATTTDGTLLGIAPLYFTTTFTKKIIKPVKTIILFFCNHGFDF